MDLNGILEYVTEGMKWLAVGGATGYIGIMLSGTFVSLFSKRIRDQQELDTVVEEESSKLELDGVKGVLRDYSECVSYVDSDGISVIEVGGFYANRGGVRHELYHHFKGDCKRSVNNWPIEAKYLLMIEPRACLYQSTKIKL